MKKSTIIIIISIILTIIFLSIISGCTTKIEYKENTVVETIIIKEVETIYVPTEVPIYVYVNENNEVVETTKEEKTENSSYDNSHLYYDTVVEGRHYYGVFDEEDDVVLENCIYDACEEFDVPIAFVLALIENSSRFDYTYATLTSFGLLCIPLDEVKNINTNWGYNVAEVHDNIYAGVRMIKVYLEETNNNYIKAAMLYEWGWSSAENLFHQGIYTSKFALDVNKSRITYEIN